MKTIPLSLLIAVMATVLPVSAQEGQPHVRPPRPRMLNQPMQPGIPATRQDSEFPTNLKLTLEGALFGQVPTDFSILSGGPVFSATLPLKPEGEAPIIGNVEGVITAGTPYSVQISIGARVPVTTGNNIEYRDFTFRSTVRVVPGKKVTLWEKGDQKLQILLEEIPD